MGAAASKTTIELESVIRRIVREEIVRLLRAPAQSLLEDWRQEGPEDPEGDEAVLAEALAVLRAYQNKPDAWMSWEEFETELDEAEAASELSH